MDSSGPGGKSLSFKYNANNEELEELGLCDDDPPTPQLENSLKSENASPKKTTSILDKYFKSARIDKSEEKEIKPSEDSPKHVINKEVSSSPVKDYFSRLSKRNTIPEDVKETPNETWKLFHDFKYKIAQAVEDIKSRSGEDAKEKSLPRDNSMSDSEENSIVKDSDQSVGDTDNQVSSLDSSIQNLSELTQPVTAKANDKQNGSKERNNSESTDDTHKNMDDTPDMTKDLYEDNLFDVESGVEALEEINMDVENSSPDNLKEGFDNVDTLPPPPVAPPRFDYQRPKTILVQKPKCYFLKFSMFFLTTILVIAYTLFPSRQWLQGFTIGLWFFNLLRSIKYWLVDTYFSENGDNVNVFSPTGSSSSLNSVPEFYTIPSVKEHVPIKKHEGWINHYRFPDYDPYTYHINQTTTAFMKLEGCNLRISYTRTKVGKRALWDEKIENCVFYQHRLYNLTGARIILLPKGLVSKRHWSKKYPICVILSENEKIQVLEKEAAEERRSSENGTPEKKPVPEVESAETNTSPEKKRKFVWRKKEKLIASPDGEVVIKEGLRHRIARKMHKDKKTENISSPEPTSEVQVEKKDPEDALFFDAEMEIKPQGDEDDFDDKDLIQIKEFLEENETEVGLEGPAESEWSLRTKKSKDLHAHLYLFARTGREKLEWYRRLNTAIAEANASCESSAADEKSSSDVADKDATAYRISDAKESVAFTKTTTKDSLLESVMSGSNSTLHTDMAGHEKLFWPYLFKIIQAKSTSPLDDRLLPADVTWLNACIARCFFDVMRDPNLLGKVQMRIQRKLNTLKLPSFMSPLVLAEVSLAGACPLLRAVAAAAADERGVWLHASLAYQGGATLTILTQINLMKLKEKNMTLEEELLSAENMAESDASAATTPSNIQITTEKKLRERKPAIFDSDLEDSAESSSDDESPSVNTLDTADLPTEPTRTPTSESPASSKNRFFRIVDKVATNKIFQQMAEYKYVKRAMEGLSNTDIKLQLEVRGLHGVIAANLPPPPHDRLWVGFLTNPQIELKARPAFGARAVRLSHISNWIEQKLIKEFEKVLVLPNMEDFSIDLMTPTPVEFE